MLIFIFGIVVISLLLIVIGVRTIQLQQASKWNQSLVEQVRMEYIHGSRGYGFEQYLTNSTVDCIINAIESNYSPNDVTRSDFSPDISTIYGNCLEWNDELLTALAEYYAPSTNTQACYKCILGNISRFYTPVQFLNLGDEQVNNLFNGEHLNCSC